MPRVNRDLQRRMAARRDRERRRPSADRSYRFGSPQPTLGSEEVPGQETPAAGNGEDAARALEAASRRSRSARGATVEASPAAGAQVGARPAHQPFSSFKEEYAYVYGDLRRVGLVIGSLLVLLIALYFVLPH
jgi:hypothetical protein